MCTRQMKNNIAGLIVLFLSVLSVLSGVANGQYYVSQQGHLLDANPRIGSFGLNTNARLDSLIPRANLYVTGNITGGARFQGVVPYRSSSEFQGSLGSGTLSDFRRDSTGLNNLSSPVGGHRPYIDASRSVTRTYGKNVVNTGGINRVQLTPVGATIPGQYNYDSGSSMRPLSKTYSLGSSSIIPKFRMANTHAGPTNLRSPATQTPETSRANLFRTGIAPEQKNIRSTQTETSPHQLRELYQQPTSTTEQSKVSAGQQDQTDQMRQSNSPVPFQLHERQTDQADLTEQSSDKTPDESDTSAVSRPGATLIQPQLFHSPLSRSSRLGAGGGITTTAPIAKIGNSDDSSSELAEAYRQQSEFYTKRGEKLMQQKLYYQAANAYGTAILYGPQDARLYLAKAQALLGAGEYMSSAYFLSQALELSPELAETETKLEQIFPDRKKFEEQMKELDTWQKRSGQPMLLFLKGYALYIDGDIEQAKEALTEAQRLQGQNRSVKILLEAVEVRKSKE
jgi:predicted negative regulator of RcsB-dependent stress response